MTSAFRRTFRTGLAGTSGPLIVPVSIGPLVSGSCMATSGGVFRPFIVVFVALSHSFPLKCVNCGVSEVLKWLESGGCVGDRVIFEGDTWRMSRVGRKMPVIELNPIATVGWNLMFYFLRCCCCCCCCSVQGPGPVLTFSPNLISKTPTINKQISLVTYLVNQ